MKLLATFFLTLIFLPVVTLASGISVSPAKLELAVQAGTTISEALTVTNPTADVQLFEIYADDFTDMFAFNPATFTLEAGARKTVQMTVNPRQSRLSDSSVLSTTLSVVSKPLADSRFQANTGVKIPASITLNQTNKKPIPYQIGIALASLAVAAYLSLHRIDRRMAT